MEGGDDAVTAVTEGGTVADVSVAADVATPGAGADIQMLVPDAAIELDAAGEEVLAADTESPDTDSPAPDTDLPDADSPAPDTDSPDTAPPDVEAPDTTAADTAPDTVTLTPYLPPPPVPCQQTSPRRLFENLVAAGDQTIIGSAFGASDALPFGPFFSGALNSPVAVPGTIGGPELLVSSHDGGVCRIAVLSSAGFVLSETSLPSLSCGAPVVADGLVAVPINAPAAGAIAWLTYPALLLQPPVALPAHVTSPLAVVGAEVVVGAAAQLLRVGHGGITAQQDSGLGVVRRVLVVDDVVGVAIGADDATTPGLGNRFARFAVSSLVADAPIAFPATSMAEPIALGDCAIANGSSHWWCPSGLLVAGGDGWLAAYDLVSGAPRGELTVERIITGLSAGDDGAIYNGSSHWLGGWDMSVADFLVSGAPTVATLAGEASADPVCIAAPLLDEDGSLAFLVGSKVQRLETSGGELAPGWSRSGGNAEGGGVPRGPAETCPTTSVHLFARNERTTTSSTVDDLAHLAARTAAGDALLVLGTASPTAGGLGAPPRLWSFALGGALAWTVDPLPGQAVLDSPLGLATAGERVAVAATVGDGVAASAVELAFLTTTGQPLFNQTLAPIDLGLPFSRILAGLTTYDDDILVAVGTFPLGGASVGWLAELDMGGAGPAAPLIDTQFDVPGPTQMAGVRRVQDALWVYGHNVDSGTGDVAAVLLRFDAEFGFVSGVSQYPTPGVERRFVDLLATAGGASLAERRLEVATSLAHGAVVRLDLDGNELSRALLPFPPVAIDGLPDGREVVVSADGALGIVDGFVVDTHAAGAGGSAIQARGLATFGQNPWIAGHSDVGGTLNDIRLVSVNVFGHTSCARAGRCAAVACDDGNPCTSEGCTPSDGVCASTPRPDGTECGPAESCLGGVCQ